MVATECLAAYLLSNREHVSSVEVHPCEQSSTSLPVILCGQPQLPGAIQDRGEYNIEPEGTTSGSSHSILDTRARWWPLFCRYFTSVSVKCFTVQQVPVLSRES